MDLRLIAGLCLALSATPAAADTLAAIITDFEHYALEQDPVTAGRQGDLAALARWPDDSPAADAVRRQRLTDFKKRLASVNPPDDEAALNRDFLARRIGTELESIEFDENRLPFAADDAFFNVPDYVARSTIIRNEAEAQAWLKRLAALPGFYATETSNAQRGLDTGFDQAVPVVQAALRSAKAAADEAPSQSSLLLPFAHLPATIPDAGKLQAEALDLVTTKVKPAQRAFVAFLEGPYMTATRRSIGFAAVPNGAAYYAFTARRHTTTALTPEEIHEIGLKEVARIHAEMNTIIAETGFKGSFADFQAYLRTDKRFYVTERQTLLEKASEIAKRIDGELPRWFGLLPRLTYGVKPVPAAIEESYTSARYWEGSPEQGTAGGFMVNTSHLDQRPLYELPALALHEAVPGHHLQIALAQENRTIPQFRRDADLTAFVEGWALYSEKLGREMGIYRDAYERFGQLSMEMWRACRLVVDTGLHAKGWTRQQAIDYLAGNTALSAKNVEVEVDRYIGWPGQALGYKIGEIKILELRARAEAALGKRFDIRKFHDFVLSAGPLPLDLLETRVDRWIRQQAG
jgi:uncharacterized protein (DUF885 family)